MVVRRRMRPRGEASYRTRTVRGATYFTSRQAFEDLTIVVQRFPGATPDGPSYVLIPGIGVSSRYFGPTAAELSKHGTVYLVDLPGFGAAPDPRRDVSITDHAGVLATFLEAAGLTHPVLVGHSWGTQVVTQLEVDHPGLVQHLVLMSPTLRPDARRFWRSIGLLARDGFREPPVVNALAIADYLVRCGIPYGLRQMPHMLNDRIEERLPRVRAHTLVLFGDRDPIVTEPWIDEVTSLVPGADSHRVRGAHVVMYTDPVTIARHIREHAQS